MKFKEKKFSPLCFDIEVASICDLACAFCYRQYVSTPDKIMKKELAFKLIDQASELNVPSMKFNWRGEPLLNPKLLETPPSDYDEFKLLNYFQKLMNFERKIDIN